MPRKNRKKLHRRKRLAAEARQQSAQARLRSRVERDLREQDLRAALDRGRDVVAARMPGIVASADELMRLGGVRPPAQERVRRLWPVLARMLPELAQLEQLPFLLLLADRPWVRDVEALPHTAGGWRRRREALVRHLFVRFEVPRFLLAHCAVEPAAVARFPLEDAWQFRMIAWLGDGGSLRKAPVDVLPTPLTRRMAHALLQVTARVEPMRAVRGVQVRAHGGSDVLLERLMRTRLARLQGVHPEVGEAFWDRCIGWLCRQDALPTEPSVLADLLDWVDHTRRIAVVAGEDFELAGRSVRRLLEQALPWAEARRVAQGEYPDPGYLDVGEADWTFRRLVGRMDLNAEGHAMRHCVRMYHRLANSGRVALYSLRHRGQRRVTIEVGVGHGGIRQVKGFANRAADEEELRVVRAWALRNGLTLRSQL